MQIWVKASKLNIERMPFRQQAYRFAKTVWCALLYRFLFYILSLCLEFLRLKTNRNAIDLSRAHMQQRRAHYTTSQYSVNTVFLSSNRELKNGWTITTKTEHVLEGFYLRNNRYEWLTGTRKGFPNENDLEWGASTSTPSIYIQNRVVNERR